MTQIKGDGFVLQHISHGEYQLVFSIEADPNEIDAAIDHVFKTEVK